MKALFSLAVILVIGWLLIGVVGNAVWDHSFGALLEMFLTAR